jgi:putative ABC transport system permease protein
MLIGLYLDHELNYDRFHADSERIYRLTDPWGTETSVSTPAFLPNPWPRAIADQFPEIEAYTRIQKRIRYNPMVAYGDTRFFEDGFINADSTFFRLFNYKLKYGDARSALKEPGSIILSESKAIKFFGTENALDKMLTLDNERSLRVTGVLEELPSQSHLDFNFVMPMDSLRPVQMVYSYFRIAPGTNIAALEAKIRPYLKNRYSETFTSHKFQPKFQAIQDIHLESNLHYEFKDNGNKNNLYLITAVGVLILLIACFNYINITTALVSLRLKEFGMRRTLGASRSQLIIQAVVESIAASWIAFVIAIGSASLLYVPFSALLGKTLLWSAFLAHYALTGVAVATAIGMLSGIYPAIIFSGIQPVDALRGRFFSSDNSSTFRRFLLAAQYVISAILISGAFIISGQLDMVTSRNPGFDRSQVIVINGRTADGLEKHMGPLKQALESVPDVESVAFSQTLPGDYSNMASISYKFEGTAEDRIGTKTIFVSHDFVETLGIQMALGRDFSHEYADSATYVINEACAKRAGWTDPVGKHMTMTILDRMKGPVIGVMKDFHFASMHSAIEPIALVILPESFQKVIVRARQGSDINALLGQLSKQWTGILPDYPFEYQFLDNTFASLYDPDLQFSDVFKIFTALAILLTCIGLYGLISFEVNRRMKEIGIRKISGASISQIFAVINRTTVVIILIAIPISIPITWFALSRWLENFAYAIDLTWWYFLFAFLTLMIISISTTGYRIYNAAITNPAQVLRSN